MTRHNIELHIEELVLHGFSPSDRYRIAEAIERELVQLFSRQSAPSALLGGLRRAELRCVRTQPTSTVTA